MAMKQAVLLGLKIIALTVIMFLCFAMAANVVETPGSSAPPAEQSNAALLLLLVCFLNTVVLAYAIMHSHWWGLKLMAAVFVVFYGVMTVMAQIEAAVFITRLPPGTLPRLFPRWPCSFSASAGQPAEQRNQTKGRCCPSLNGYGSRARLQPPM